MLDEMWEDMHNMITESGPDAGMMFEQQLDYQYPPAEPYHGPTNSSTVMFFLELAEF